MTLLLQEHDTCLFPSVVRAEGLTPQTLPGSRRTSFGLSRFLSYDPNHHESGLLQLANAFHFYFVSKKLKPDCNRALLEIRKTAAKRPCVKTLSHGSVSTCAKSEINFAKSLGENRKGLA